MIKTFHSIGQGTFYTELFGHFTIVYDCGSDYNIPLIKKNKKEANIKLYKKIESMVIGSIFIILSWLI